MIGLLIRSSPFTLPGRRRRELSDLPAWEKNGAGIARVGGATRVDWGSETRETFSRPSAIEDVGSCFRFAFHFKIRHSPFRTNQQSHVFVCYGYLLI